MNKALLIGINTYKNVSGLYGCVNDVEDVCSLLTSFGVVTSANVQKLLNEKATRQAIIEAIRDLVMGATIGDHLYIHFSGHGAQVPSTDPNEPDFADEVLCPQDFDWSPASCIKDDDLRQLLAMLPKGTTLTFTADSCHGGDFEREVGHPSAGTPRTPTPPAEVSAKLLSRSRTRRLQSVEFGGNSAIISACRPWETAKDSSFDGRETGAFTHFFVTNVRANPTAALDQVLTEIAPLLLPYEMHPVAEGSANVRGRPYVTSASREPASSLVVQLPRRMTTLWEYCWSAEVFGHRGDVCVDVTLSGRDFVGHVRTHLFGGGEWTVSLSGNATVSLDLAFGVKLRLTVRDWSLRAGMLRFYLSVDLVSRFFPAIPVGAVPVSTRLDSMSRDAASAIDVPQSAADFMAVVNLNIGATAIDTKDISPLHSGARGPGEIVPMAWGDEGWGPNWREERTVRPPQLARATKRFNVVFDPIRGGGWVAFRRWATDNERDPSFIMHIGNGFFGGWGSVHYTVQGVYEVDDPFPQRTPMMDGLASSEKTLGQARAG